MLSEMRNDLGASEQVGKYLDKYFYPKLMPQYFANGQRKRDIESQYAGIDVHMVNGCGVQYLIDEKAQTDYINQNLPTNAFEIEFLDKVNHAPTVGWLCDEKIRTSHYLIVWLTASNENPKTLTWDQITGAYCILVSKRKILDELEKRGLSICRMQQAATLYRLRNDGQNKKERVCSGIFYYFTSPNKKAEAPFNVLITKKLLEDWAELICTVTPTGITEGRQSR